jgi:GNAT superfamily N-acetyltransferase
MSLTIRPATSADEDFIVAANMALAFETESKRLDEFILRKGVRAIFADPHKGFYTVAERDGQVVGQILITFEYSDWRFGFYWWIQSVYVLPEARGNGVFRAIFNHLHAQAIANPEVIGLRLYAEHENKAAHRVYRSVGMVDEPYGLFGLYPLPGRESSFGAG